MRIAISYPPLESDKGIPLLTQNRQFQWFNSPTYIYPVVPATAATLLKNKGYDVIWDDAIAQKKTYLQWFDDIKNAQVDLIAIETKTPVVKRHWKIIDELKEVTKAKIVLLGDHVTACPEESLKNCSVDYVLTGGAYDFQLLSLADHLIKGEPLGKGFYYRDNGNICDTGRFDLAGSLDDLPHIDRDLTQWKLYAHENGNFKFKPGAYIMSSRDCWWRKKGGCTFCAWTVTYPQYKVRSVDHVLDEIGMLIEQYGIREIFDDSGTLPGGDWLKRFCEGMIERGYHKKVYLGCNLKPGFIDQKMYHLMKQANFRLLLFGIESANPDTLKRINKGNTVEDIQESVRMAKIAGLEPHITCMLGYPWESYEEAKNTIDFSAGLFKKGWIDTLQATVVIPYPGTQLFKECKENGWLLTEDWDRYDMRENVMKSALSTEQVMELTQRLYRSFMSIGFIWKKLIGIRSKDDVAYLFTAGKKLLGHLLDFRPKTSCSCASAKEECCS